MPFISAYLDVAIRGYCFFSKKKKKIKITIAPLFAECDTKFTTTLTGFIDLDESNSIFKDKCHNWHLDISWKNCDISGMQHANWLKINGVKKPRLHLCH